MDSDIINILSVIVVIICVAVSVFQMLLSLGFPFGEFAMGGYHRVLPINLRVVSAMNALILLFMGFVLLQHTKIINGLNFLPTNIFVWGITIFLGLNTIANLLSRSKKERFIMTPLSGITFILCLLIVLS
ncbi:hypothetical protein [Aureibacillus halotolerans]|uniref:Uncharacterized protein n=1 Tax=Aureibacillus halotolerans TaxID=1508390 RepID=A0A4R6U474_9BACI|nr:hypothetical protein [Aureibacillus halotolerans]TDQ41250.1 hypothetical protein EV213_104248 [Aureibacillus halotolerans]